MDICMYQNKFTCVYIYIYIYMYIRVCTYIYIYTYCFVCGISYLCWFVQHIIFTTYNKRPKIVSQEPKHDQKGYGSEDPAQSTKRDQGASGQTARVKDFLNKEQSHLSETVWCSPVPSSTKRSGKLHVRARRFLKQKHEYG